MKLYSTININTLEEKYFFGNSAYDVSKKLTYCLNISHKKETVIKLTRLANIIVERDDNESWYIQEAKVKWYFPDERTSQIICIQ